MPTPEQEHHEIDYIELAVTDMAGAKRFYQEAFGWAFNDYGDAYAGIRRRSGGEVGGRRLNCGRIRRRSRRGAGRGCAGPGARWSRASWPSRADAASTFVTPAATCWPSGRIVRRPRPGA